jgi:hypothetical protein
MERNIMTKLLFDFLIALAVVLAAAAIIAFIVAKVILGWLQGAEGKHQRASTSLR